MEQPSFTSLANLDTFAPFETRRGVDMRPTLLRVLTDLYMQKLQHTPDEERHYTELALRLIEVVDAPTRAAVSIRLARHLSPPLRVVQRLIKDLPEVSAPLRNHQLLQAAHQLATVSPVVASVSAVPSVLNHTPNPAPPSAASDKPNEQKDTRSIDATMAAELNEMFFSAGSDERRLILRNLDLVVPTPRLGFPILRDASIGRRLEAAALAHKREDFARHLAYALHIPLGLARRIATDDLGDTMVIAAKAMTIGRDLLYRILLFANPVVGHSVERVHTLATLFDEIKVAAAEDIVAIWQALPAQTRVATKQHSQQSYDRAQTAERTAATSRRKAVTFRTGERRYVS